MEEVEERRRKRECVENEQFTCKICLFGFENDEEEGEDEVLPLSLCEHFYHSSCFKNYLKAQIDESKFPLVCPEVSCKVELADLDLKEVLAEADYNKYSAFALNTVVDTHKDLSWCPTADCKFAFVYDPAEERKGEASGAEGRDGNELRCPLCKKHYCLTCKVAYHEGESCKDYQLTHNTDKLDAAFFDFA